MTEYLEILRSKHKQVYRAIVFIIAVILIVSFFPKQNKFKYEFQLGKQWLTEDLYAPFDFSLRKTKDEINLEKSSILEKAVLYIRIDSAVTKNKIFGLKENFAQKWSRNTFDKELSAQAAEAILTRILNIGVLEAEAVLKIKSPKAEVLVINANGEAKETSINNFFSVQSAYDYAVDSLKQLSPLIDKGFVLELIENQIAYNAFYDEDFSKKVVSQQINEISVTRDLIRRGTHIISKGEQVSKEKFQILESLKSEFIAQQENKASNIWIILGLILLVAICLSMLLTFLYLFRRDILDDNIKINFIFFIIAIKIVMLSIALRLEIIHIYILPFCVLPIITRVFYDTRTALFTHLISCMIMGIIVPSPFEFIFLQFTAGVVSIFSIINMRNRSQLFITSLLVFSSLSLSYLGLGIIQEGKIQSLDFSYFAWFGISSLITLFAYPLIYLFEKMFGFVSEVTLLELADTNSELLRQLAIKAPGTFQHSLQVANLAEEAIRQLKGNTLLIRAGALYHDIGKMDAPMYFIENQTGGTNPHADLSAEESAHVIINHVIRGIEIAKDANLPDQIIDFIRTHHGTTKAEYFYRTHKMLHPDEEVDLSLFQYPGPIPYSKETAVLMMADGVEASSRSLKKYDSESINDLVERIINHQIEENQFAYSDISFKDIALCKKFFKKKLMNIYHLRIEYPSASR